MHILLCRLPHQSRLGPIQENVPFYRFFSVERHILWFSGAGEGRLGEAFRHMADSMRVTLYRIYCVERHSH